MSHSIGIIGPADLVNKTMGLMESYPLLTGVPLAYSSEREAVRIAKENLNAAHAFLFTGYVPYRLVHNENVDKPLFYFSIAGTSLNRSLFHFHIHDGIDVSQISIDTISEQEVKEMYDELELDMDGVYINKATLDQFSAEDYFQFHLRLYQEGATQGAITSINSVAERLKSSGVPVQKLVPTQQGMRNTLRLISTFVEGEQARGKQLVMLMVQMYDPEEKNDKAWNATGRWLEKEGKRYQASVFWNSGEIIVLMNQRLFDKYTAHDQAIPLTQELKKRVGEKMVVGIGMGETMLDAEENARASLELSRNTGARHTYAINQDKEVIGPMSLDGKKEPLFRLMSTDAHLTKLAQRTTLSVKTLSKVERIYADSGSDLISSKTLKDGLGITLRSANRILTKLVDAGVATPKGYEDQVGRGRPRVLYSIDFKSVEE